MTAESISACGPRLRDGHYHHPKDGLLSDAGRAEKLGYIEEIVNSGFLYDIDEDDLADGVYAGLMAGLQDPYSRYYTAEQYEEETTVSEGNYSGVGIVMTMNTDGTVDITRVYEGSPAERAGVLAGDVITEIDGLPVKGLTLSDVAGMIRNSGKDSTDITVLRGEETLSFTVSIERVKCHVELRCWKMVPDMSALPSLPEWHLTSMKRS